MTASELIQQADLRAGLWALGGVVAVLLLIVLAGGRARRGGELTVHVAPDERIAALERRVEGVEGRVQKLATKDAVQSVEVAVARVDGRLDTVGQQLATLGSGVERIEGFLMVTAAQAIMPPQVAPLRRDHPPHRPTEEAP